MIFLDFRYVKARLNNPTPLEVFALIALLGFLAAVLLQRA
jgi:hypothetical protein